MKFYNFLMNNPLFGNLLRTFIKYKVIPLRAKIIASTIIIVTITTSAYFFVPFLFAKIIMGIIGFCVIIYIWHFPHKRKEEDGREGENRELHRSLSAGVQMEMKIERKEEEMEDGSVELRVKKEEKEKEKGEEGGNDDDHVEIVFE